MGDHFIICRLNGGCLVQKQLHYGRSHRGRMLFPSQLQGLSNNELITAVSEVTFTQFPSRKVCVVPPLVLTNFLGPRH